eukprot:1954143-Pyramimonas_sp.AAC.1
MRQIAQLPIVALVAYLSPPALIPPSLFPLSDRGAADRDSAIARDTPSACSTRCTCTTCRQA